MESKHIQQIYRNKEDIIRISTELAHIEELTKNVNKLTVAVEKSNSAYKIMLVLIPVITALIGYIVK